MAQKQDENTDDISSTCGQNVVVNGNTAEWCSVDSGGRLFVKQPLTKKHSKFVLKLTESGHADVGILTVNPNVLSDLTLVGSLRELTVIQTAKLHNKTGIIQLKRSKNGDQIVHRSDGENQYFEVNKSDDIWITVNIIYGTVKVQIDSDFFTISAVKGENISISSNQREAHLNIVNPCAVCFFESPIMRGETLCFSVEPIVRDGKVTHNFSFKVAITEINPAEFLPAKPYLYDITFLPVSDFETSFKKVQGEIAFQYTTEGVASVQYKTNKSILQNITFEKSYLLIEICKVKLKYLSKRNDDPEIPTRPSTNAPHDPEIPTGPSANVPDSPAIPTGVGISDVTVTTTDEFESVYDNSKIQLDLIRREVGNLSIYSNENNESIYDDLIPRGSEAECDQWKQSDLHQAVEGIYKRLESIEERLCNNTGSKVASLQQTDTSSLESDIKEIRRMLERLSGEPVKLREKVNVQISRPISEEDERSVLEVIQPNFTEFVQLLDTIPFMDRMFQKSHLTIEEYERIRTLSQANRVEANRDLSMIIFRRQGVDLAIFKQCLIETKQDGVLGKLFPKK